MPYGSDGSHPADYNPALRIHKSSNLPKKTKEPLQTKKHSPISGVTALVRSYVDGLRIRLVMKGFGWPSFA
jgi:hypothetical protein